jgi:trimeric autotransporter adhesin
MKHVTFHLPSFLRRVRIHGGEFDSSARAMNRVSEKGSLMTYESAIHVQAEPRIVRGSTIERKHMSTKTTFKRIALVAVAALGFGVISVAPSQADVTGLVVTTTNGTGAVTGVRTGESTTAATIKVQFLGLATSDTVSVTIAAGLGNPTTANLAGAGLWFTESTTSTNAAPTVDTASTLNAATAGPIVPRATITPGSYFRVISPGTANGTYSVTMRYSVGETTTSTVPAGTYSFNAIVNSVQGGQAKTDVYPFTITVAAAPVVVVTPAAANAKAFLHAGDSEYPATKLADSATAGSNLPGTRIGTIRVSNFSANDIAARDTITVTMTGVGFLTTTNLATNITGRSFVVANTDSVTANIMPDGASGTGTITITTAAGASFVKTVTFFDTRPVAASAVVAKAFIKAGATTSDVFAVTVRDSLGNPIAAGGVSVTAAPTDTRTTQVVGSATAATCTWNVAGAAYHCPITGAAADKFGPVDYTITVTGTGINAATVLRTTARVTFADNVATKAVLTGPATGTPGASVDYTLTLTEKNGYPVADQTYGAGGLGGALFSTTAADRVVSGWSAANAPFSASESFTSKSGVITSAGVLPIAGTATLTLTLIGDGITSSGAIDKTIGKTKVTVSTDITNPGVDAATDAANEATDAANAATDAALAAAEAADAATTAAQEASDAVAALSESVTKLIAGLQAQIKSLAAVVAKIAKKVKA